MTDIAMPSALYGANLSGVTRVPAGGQGSLGLDLSRETLGMTTKEWIDQLQTLIDRARTVDQLPEARRETLDELDWALNGLRHDVLMPRQLRTEVLSL
ncbi:MAG: hypothetical protein AB7P12_15750, partial [Alphaproteobacteria bacterium]